MILWKNADPSDLKLLESISILLSKHPKLLDYIFCSTDPRLRASASEIKTDANSLSAGKNLLVRLALDIWSGEGEINFNEIYQTLDNENFTNLLKSMVFLMNYYNGPPRGQLKMDTSLR